MILRPISTLTDELQPRLHGEVFDRDSFRSHMTSRVALLWTSHYSINQDFKYRENMALEDKEMVF